jgi:hypothetical protein
VVAYAVEQPAYGQIRVANEMKKRGLFVSPGGVRSIWLRHDLQTIVSSLVMGFTKSSEEPKLIVVQYQRIIYNWVRPHWGLGKRTTPAMAIGLCLRPLSI